MGSRMLHQDSRVSYGGCIEIITSFLLVSPGSVILTPTATGTSVRGEGLLPSGSVTWSATGTYTLTLGVGHTYRYVVYSDATLTDTGLGIYATLGAATNEGSSTLPLVFTLWTYNAGGTKTDFVGTRCNICIDVKNSLAGS